MNPTFLWIPTLDLSSFPEAFQEWQARRFLATHGGRGHLIASTPMANFSSVDILSPCKGTHWYCRAWRNIPGKNTPLDATLEMAVPRGVTDPAWELLNRLVDTLPLRRLILTRPPEMALDQILVPLETLIANISGSIWLDLATFGWDAISYLTAWNNRLQVHAVHDRVLARFIQLAGVLERPIVLSDWSPLTKSVPLGLLPDFPIDKEPPRVLNSLPIGGRDQ